MTLDELPSEIPPLHRLMRSVLNAGALRVPIIPVVTKSGETLYLSVFYESRQKCILTLYRKMPARFRAIKLETELVEGEVPSCWVEQVGDLFYLHIDDIVVGPGYQTGSHIHYPATRYSGKSQCFRDILVCRGRPYFSGDSMPQCFCYQKRRVYTVPASDSSIMTAKLYGNLPTTSVGWASITNMLLDGKMPASTTHWSRSGVTLIQNQPTVHCVEGSQPYDKAFDLFGLGETKGALLETKQGNVSIIDSVIDTKIVMASYGQNLAVGSVVIPALQGIPLTVSSDNRLLPTQTHIAIVDRKKKKSLRVRFKEPQSTVVPSPLVENGEPLLYKEAVTVQISPEFDLYEVNLCPDDLKNAIIQRAIRSDTPPGDQEDIIADYVFSNFERLSRKQNIELLITLLEHKHTDFARKKRKALKEKRERKSASAKARRENLRRQLDAESDDLTFIPAGF